MIFIWWISLCRCNIDFSKSLDWAYHDILIKRLAPCCISRTHFKWIKNWLLDRSQMELLFTEIRGFLNPWNCKIELSLMVKDLQTIFVALHFETDKLGMTCKYICFQFSLKRARQILIQDTTCMKHQEDGWFNMRFCTCLQVRKNTTTLWTTPPYEHQSSQE